MDHAQSEKTILRQCAIQKLPVPERIKNAPELAYGLELFYSGFVNLSSSRVGEGLSQVSWFDIHRYCKINGIKGDQRADFFYLIQGMDRHYLEKEMKKLKAKSKSKG